MKRIKGIPFSFYLTGSLMMGLATSSYSSSPVAGDVIVVIDESGSMSGEQSWVAGMIPMLEEQLKLYGIGSESQENSYGLVGYGNGAVRPRSLSVENALLMSSSQFSEAAKKLVASGGTEDGWWGIDFALEEYPRRNGAAVNIILVTDEDRDNANNAVSYASTIQKLSDNNALLNAVVNTRIRCGDGTSALGMDSKGTGYVRDGQGGFTTCENATATSGSEATIAHYVDMAVENGGAVWDLQFLRSGGVNAESFTKALLAIKVDEILKQRPVGDLVAVAQATPNPAVAGQAIQLDGSDSYHQKDDRSIVSWEWDLDNDGTYDVSGPVVSTSFSVLGEYPITLRVTDDSETPLVSTTRLVVDINTPPLPPTANAGGPYYFCPQSQPWFLDASASSNPDDGLSETGLPIDKITSLAWDLDDDLVFDDAEGDVVDVTDMFSGMGVGDYQVRLRATDNTEQSFPSSGQSNLSDLAFSTVSVLDASDSRCNCLSDFAVRTKMKLAQLTWGDTGASSYAIYRSTQQGGPYERIATTDNRYSTYLDLGLEQDTTYYYVVSELALSGKELCRSQEVSVTPTVRRENLRNRPPVIDSTPITSATEGVLYQYDVEATDPNTRDRIEYSLKLAPTGMTINSTSGLIEWTPVNAQVGTQSVIVQVSDSQSALVEQAFEITVANVNQAPVLSSQPVTIATELEPYQYSLVALDPDLNDALTYRLVQAPMGMEVNALTGEVNWTPSAGQAGSHTVTARVTDSEGLSDSQTFTIEVLEQNYFPVIISSPVTEAIVNSLYRYDVDGTDANANESITYSLGVFPEGMTIEPLTGVISWTPNETQQGAHNIIVIATDSRGGGSSQSFTIQVAEENLKPSIITAELPSAVEDQSYTFVIEANDPNANDTLTFSLESGPVNMTLNSQTGELNWLPVNSHVGTQTLVIKVTDAAGLYDEVTLPLVVQNVNDAPVFLNSDTPLTTASEGGLYQYQVQVEDPDADEELTFTLLQAPAGMTVSADTGLLQWTPTYEQRGAQSVSLRVSDKQGATDNLSFEINVVALNRAPTIVSSPVASVFAESDYQYVVESVDSEQHQVTYELTAAPLGMTINPQSGVITWEPTQAQIGDHSIVITVTDSLGASSKQSYTLKVLDNTNNLPQISSQPTSPAIVDQEYAYAIVATDADGDALTYSLKTAPQGMTLSSTGALRWTPTEEQVGSHSINVAVSDGFVEVSQSFTLAVVTATAANAIPEITSQPTTPALVGQEYRYDLTATDADGDALTFSLSEGPAGMTVSNSGALRWTPADDQVDSFAVAVAVSDGQVQVTQHYTLDAIVAVADNNPPVISSLPTSPAIAEQDYRYDIIATDADGDTLSYSLIGGPDGMSLSADGKLRWTPTQAQMGSYAISLVVSDGVVQMTQRFTLEVIADTADNTPPAIASVPSTLAIIGEKYLYNVQASDVDGNTLNYGLLTAPDGMSMSPAGQINWLPSPSQEGDHAVSLYVSDGLSRALQSFTLTVSLASDIELPYLANVPTAEATVNQPYSYKILALDANGYAVEVVLVSGPQGMQLVENNGFDELIWTPTEGDCIKDVTLRLTDYQGQSVEVTYSITVHAAVRKLNRLQCSLEDNSCGQP